MTNHKISADGQNIECHAAPDAECRTRPDCETEGWDSTHCLDHDPGHPVTGGHACWQLEWVNATDLEDTCAGPEPVTIHPGRAVNITWEGEYCIWNYAQGNEDDVRAYLQEHGENLANAKPKPNFELAYTTRELDALPAGTLIRDITGTEHFKTVYDGSPWRNAHDDQETSSRDIARHGAAKILYRPGNQP